LRAVVRKLKGQLPDLPRALCKGLDTELFFSDDGCIDPDPFIASLCNRCPESVNCLSWAMANSEHGVWGATTFKQRAALKRPIVRLRCPGCHSEAILEEPTTETCLSCGLSWRI
jgi:hypothetical protein